jgi:hypothetical protein
MEELFNKYMKDLATFTDLLESCNPNNLIKIKQLKYKVSCHRNMVDDLQRAMAKGRNESSGLNIPVVSGSLLIPDVHTEKNLILARAINYIADDVQEDGNKLAKEIAEGLITLLDKQ